MIEFSSNLETKIPQIDEQHKELINRINNVLALEKGVDSKEVTEKTINMLGAYIEEHFRDEEELQRKSGYPDYEWHREQHRLYIDSFKRLKEEYEKNGPSINFTLELNKSIIQWIVTHIRSADTDLGKFINANG